MPKKSLIPIERIEAAILLIRGQKVMLDRDLAKLYGVTTGRLNEQVKRNQDRFPKDFMFQLNEQEFEEWKSQFAISNRALKMGVRKRPLAFSEQGIAMLSSVLRSKRAVQVNIQIMRTFVQLREMLATHKDLAKRLDDLEARYDASFKVVFDAIRQLTTPPPAPKRRIGFHSDQ